MSQLQPVWPWATGLSAPVTVMTQHYGALSVQLACLDYHQGPLVSIKDIHRTEAAQPAAQAPSRHPCAMSRGRGGPSRNTTTNIHHSTPRPRRIQQIWASLTYPRAGRQQIHIQVTTTAPPLCSVHSTPRPFAHPLRSTHTGPH
ncbi:hypothetical protein INR49_011579 [Caranx melampygus]|nr:hypothetical protein INR49_011579 [Caranx melampygus]